MPEPAIDLPQLLAAIDVITILRSVSVRGRPGDRLDELRPFDREQLQKRERTEKKIEKAEEKVKELFNISHVRVRDHGEIARIEIGRDEMEKMFNKLKLYQLDLELKNIGFKYASLDLYGYRSGKLIVIND